MPHNDENGVVVTTEVEDYYQGLSGMAPNCLMCANLLQKDYEMTLEGWACKAFPSGIPHIIIVNQLSHAESLTGSQFDDNGIAFVPRKVSSWTASATGSAGTEDWSNSAS